MIKNIIKKTFSSYIFKNGTEQVRDLVEQFRVLFPEADNGVKKNTSQWLTVMEETITANNDDAMILNDCVVNIVKIKVDTGQEEILGLGYSKLDGYLVKDYLIVKDHDGIYRAIEQEI